MDVKFYKCAHCGQIIVKLVDTDVPVICCGEPMEELVADSTDASLEKHVPAVVMEGNRLSVNIGEADHPMIPEHHITDVVLVTEKGYQVAPLDPGNDPHAYFTVDEGDKPLRVYDYCNIHGLWVKEL